MRSLEQIIRDNGGDNTPGMDTHNLTGSAFPEGVEPEWVPLSQEDVEDTEYEDWLGRLDCE